MNTSTLLETFVSQLQKFESKAEMTAFFEALLTPKEIEEIANRMEIIRLLRSGESQREIAQQLSVGIATVTRGARVLKTEGLEDLLTNLDKKTWRPEYRVSL